MYDRYFDMFEYILSLVHADLRSSEGETSPHFLPTGLFAKDQDWMPRVRQSEGKLAVDKLIADTGTNCPLLQAGLFGESEVRQLSAQLMVAAMVERLKR